MYLHWRELCSILMIFVRSRFCGFCGFCGFEYAVFFGFKIGRFLTVFGICGFAVFNTNWKVNTLF